MATVAIDLSAADEARLEERARSLGVSPRALLRAAVMEFLDQPSEAFRAVADEVLEENAELYERLA